MDESMMICILKKHEVSHLTTIDHLSPPTEPGQLVRFGEIWNDVGLVLSITMCDSHEQTTTVLWSSYKK